VSGDDPHPAGVLAPVAEQGALADARLSDEHQRTAAPPSGVHEQAFDLRLLDLPPQQHQFLPSQPRAPRCAVSIVPDRLL
jgi:hypothetical protein